MMFYVAAGALGVLLGLVVPYNLSSSTLPYVAVAIVAALDSVFGAWLANLNKKFNLNVFMMGLVSNAVLAVFLTFVGDLLGITLYYVAIIVFGVRMFNNMSSIRRITSDIYFERRARDKERIARLALKQAEEEKENAKDAEEAGNKEEKELIDEPDSDKGDASEEKKEPTEKNENDSDNQEKTTVE